MINFTEIDPILEEWAKANGFTLQKEDRDYEIRSVSYYEGTGGSLWIGKESGVIWSVNIVTNSMSRKKKSAKFNASKTDLKSALDEAFNLLKTWV